MLGAHLAGQPVVAGGAAAFLHFRGRGEAGLGGHGYIHGDVGDAGCGRAGGVGGSDEDLIQVGQSHQEMLPCRRLSVRPLPVLLQAERGVKGRVWGGTTDTHTPAGHVVGMWDIRDKSHPLPPTSRKMISKAWGVRGGRSGWYATSVMSLPCGYGGVRWGVAGVILLSPPSPGTPIP